MAKAGGSATNYGILYQALGTVGHALELTLSAHTDQDEIESATLVIEPVGGARWKNPVSGYPTAGSVLYAVELAGGQIEALGLKRGEKVQLPDAVLQLKAQ